MKPLAQNTLIQNRYLIVHLIGKGGMGEVYLAVDQRLGSAVALKRTFFAGDAMLATAFEREARTLARMRHPVLPKVSDHFGENEEQYLVMEHISGDDLAKRLEIAQKPFPVSWVLFWADQLLDALSYLHTHEPPIIHRDIKPQNLKLTDENHIILLDFGLSKTSTGQTNISQYGSTGSVVGYTPHYAPMEQIRGIGTSARSDLYSLSATIYQLMTNIVPVDALSRADSMLNEMPDPITPPYELNSEIPKLVSDVILKGMEVSQEKRYPDAREMQKVLRKAFNEMQQATTADTVAFNINDNDERGAIDQPAATLAAAKMASESQANQLSSRQSAVPGSPFEASTNEKQVGSVTDLDATMAYNSAPNTGSSRQADVKTEVFLAGGNSLPVPDKQSYESQAPPASNFRSAPVEDFSNLEESTPNESASTFAALTPGATVPFISIDGDAVSNPHPQTADASDYYSNPTATDESFSSPEAPYFETPTSEPNAKVESAAYADQRPITSSKRSSKTILAVLGGLFALFLLSVVVAGGIWAFVNFGAAEADVEPTPSPSPDMTIETTPAPTVEVGVNVSTPDNIGNSNGAANGNSDILLVSPTPFVTPTPITDSTTRPTPQTIPTTPRVLPTTPPVTPKDRPTPKIRKTPVVSPTVLQ